MAFLNASKYRNTFEKRIDEDSGVVRDHNNKLHGNIYISLTKKMSGS